MNVTFEMVRSSPEIRTYITQADASLTALGFTEHSFAHVTKCAEVAARILTQRPPRRLHRLPGERHRRRPDPGRQDRCAPQPGAEQGHVHL